MMEVGEVITVADLRAAFQKQGMSESDVKSGDAIFFNTGWSALWGKNNDKFNSGEPGIGLEIAKWVIDKDLCLTGGDAWGVDVVPFPAKLAFACHSELQTKHGIYNHENLVFDGLIADKKYQFVYVFTPFPLTGATGSPGIRSASPEPLDAELNNWRWRVQRTRHFLLRARRITGCASACGTR